MKKNIIFDWSGTLLNNFDQTYETTMEIFKKLGGKKISKEKYKVENVSPYMKFWNKYFPKLTKLEQDKLFSDTLKKSKSPQLYPGVKKIIKDLSESDVKLFLLSSQPEDNLKSQMKIFGIYNYFTKVIGNIHDKKVGFKDLMKNYLKSSETIAVGDTIGEIEAGKASNLVTVGLTWGFNSKKQLNSANPDYIIDNLSGVLKILNK